MKRFTSLFIVCFLAFPFLHSCLVNNFREIKGNYTLVNEKIAIKDYGEIALYLPAEVIYQQTSQEEPFLQVVVDKNIFPSLDISVKNNRLVITQNNDSTLKPSQFKIYTNSKNLSRVEIVGSGDVLMEKEVNAKDLTIRISGAGDVKSDSLYCENIKVEISGAGNAEIKGAATQATFSISGAGDIKAFDYLVQNLDCHISGAGDVEVHVYKSLNASVSGAGDLRYKGNPESVKTNVAGAGDIRKVNE